MMYVDKFLKVPKLSTTTIKDTGLSSRIPRLQSQRMSSETLLCRTNLSPQTIPEVSHNGSHDDYDNVPVNQNVSAPGRSRRRHHSDSTQRDKASDNSKSPSSRTSSHSSSPIREAHNVNNVKSKSSIKRHKSFTGGEKPPQPKIGRFKNTSLNKSFSGATMSSSPIQMAKSCSCGSMSSGLGCSSSALLSPNIFRCESNDILSTEQSTSLGCLSCRNAYSVVVPEESPLEIKRRCSYTELLNKDIDYNMNKPNTKTKEVFDPGRVQVFVRVRPPNGTEDVSKYPLAVSIPDEEQTQLKLFDGKNDRCYQFDGVLHGISTNKEVYKTVGEPLLYSALSGFNGILMCYGQTGTGKTYTLMSNDGMSVRIFYQCFKVLNKDRRHKYTVTCSYLQIYQEKIFDLLNESRTIELSLREHPKTGVYIENLTEYVVHSPKEVLDLLKVGKRRLVFAETKMNRASSRSHAICQLKILKERVGNDRGNNELTPPLYVQTSDLEDEDEFLDGHEPSINESYQPMMMTDDEDDEDILSHVPDLEDGVTSVRGKLYICDLAGSERIKKTKASGERLQEAQHINSSLLELGNVIQALAEGKRSHVPFRNSTLTRLLQEGLSGNCKTRLVVCVAPTVKDVHETKCSLNFGSRAMKIQVMAHVNYEVDYKKLAETLAAKLENLEQEWNMQKQNYDKFIKQLRNEIDCRRSMSPMESLIMGVKSPTKHVQSLLVIELMTLQLFYNVQGKQSVEHTYNDMINFDDLPFSSANLDMMLQSMEGLLELLNDYLRDRIPFQSKDYSMSSGCSSVITSPDCIGQSVSSTYDVPSTLEPVARFLEHAQIVSANMQSNFDKVDIMAVEQCSKERFKRVINSLMQMKEMVSKKAISSLKETFEASFKDSKGKLNSLEEIVNHLDGQKDILDKLMESLDDIQSLENSLYYLLMDKALLSCMVLLRSQSNKPFDSYNAMSSEKADSCQPEIKRILEELTEERNARDKIQIELHSLEEVQLASDEKIKDAELELKTVRELRDSLEMKLLAVENKNMIFEEQIGKYKKEKESLEARIEEIEKRKLQLETSLKNSDNNNARKERSIVDLKNEKVALESLVSTLKEEITILEKERTRETDEKRRVEEELEDVRDRNIILETEWSCCREENGLLETELTALEEDKAILEDELSKYRDDVKMLEEAVNMLEAQASDYKQDIMSLKAKEERLLANVRVEKEKFNKEINGLKQEMSTLRLERRRFQRDISVSRTDKSNTERAYNALKAQKDSLQEDITLFKQEEKRLQREVSTLKSDRAKLERETNSLKNENSKLKHDIVQADKIKVELRILQKNEDKIASTFKVEKDRLYDNLVLFKDRYERMEQDFNKVMNEKDKLTKQIKKYEQTIHEKNEAANVVRMRSQSQPTNGKSQTPDKGKMKTYSSVQGALVRRSITSGEVSEVDGKVLDLQRRLAFVMAEKDDIQKELKCTRERNTNLTLELKTLESDTSKLQQLFTQLTDEKETLQSKLTKTSQSKDILVREQVELKKAVTHAQNITKQLRLELDDVSEQNRILEVDYMKIKETAKMLQGETVVLSAENEHIKKEFQNMEKEMKEAKSKVEELKPKIVELNAQVKEANAKEIALNEKASFAETKNVIMMGEQEEELLIQQLTGLNEKFNSLESTVEQLLVPKENEESEVSVEDIMEQMKKLKEDNSTLEDAVVDLKSELETVVLDAESLKEEQEEIEKVIQNDDEIMKDREAGKRKSLSENIRHLWFQLQNVKSEKVKVQKKMESVEKQVETLGQENESLSQTAQDKIICLEKEKRNYQMQIKKLQEQIEELIKERLHLEAEMEFVTAQNDELRRGIAVLLEDNSKLAAELDVVEEEFEKQEKELDSATEETKVLLRQLCTAETENLNLCTAQSDHQDDLDEWKTQIGKLKKEKDEVSQKHIQSEMKQKTLQDRLLMAELEISKLKSEHASVEGQRRLLVDDLDAADRERNLLKSELHGLARALSPLKKEVSEVIKKQECLKLEADAKPHHNISNEVAQIKRELSSFNAEKSQLEVEQCELELRLKVVGLEKEDLRIKLRSLIQDLDEQNNSPTKENLPEITELIQIVSKLINETQDLEVEEKLLSDDLVDTHHNNNLLHIRLGNSTNELRCAQEQYCLATVDRLKIKDKSKTMEKSIIEFSGSRKMNHTEQPVSPMDQGNPRKAGISPLQQEVTKLKLDIEQFEKSQENILYDIRTLNDQLNAAENNLVNVVHFKTVIEKNLRQYKERNNKLETHLRVIYNDLVEMESHIENSPNESAKVLLETLDLQKHFQSLEDDLRDTEARNIRVEPRNRTLKEEASDLMERCAALQEGKQLNPGLDLWSLITKK